MFANTENSRLICFDEVKSFCAQLPLIQIGGGGTSVYVESPGTSSPSCAVVGKMEK